ncbi:MAG TPA: aminotransferase class V-fold PLP-dependent enzyme [Thermoanaerobaculia bacterium]|nr:aminotransferase class V-fold PLP-dependent enzyme [Thermoanaerobaculia bacterium]
MSTTRRSLLLGAAAAASLLPTSARRANAALPVTAPTEGGDGEAYWEAVRAQFAFRDERVPMNAANLCPSPRVVAEEVAQLTRDIDVDCSFQNRAKFDALLEGARENVARQLGASADEIALVRNTSEANSLLHNGLSLGAGDRVVIWDQNHPSNHVAWKVRAQRFGFEVEEIVTPESPSGDDELTDRFVGALGPRTRVLALTHVSNVSGVRLPIARIAEATRARGIWLHVDGAQTWGASDVDLRALGVDSYSASAHKWFCGPKEVGLLYVRAERWTELWPGVVAPSWGADVDPDPVGARRFESLGQRDDAALAAVGVAAHFHDRLGPARVEQRVLALAARLKLGAVEAGYSLVTPAKSELSGGVCIVAVPQAQRQEIYERLYREHGIAGAATGGVRLCPHVYNTIEHVERAVAGLRALRPLVGAA